MTMTLQLALLFSLSLPEISGDSTCPTVGEVREQLAVLVPASEGGVTPSTLHANVSSAGSSVYVELLGQDGHFVAERNLERAGSCNDMAEAVAVIITSWQATFDPNLAAPSVSLPQTPPVAAPPTAIRTEKLRLGDAMPFDAGLAVLASLAGSEAAFGAKLEGCLFPGGGSWGLDLALAATVTHTQSIATPASAAEWTRAALLVGPTYRLGSGPVLVDVHLGGVLAFLRVRGTGLSSTASDQSAQLGLSAGLRGLWRWNNAATWIGADVFTYPGQDRLTIGNYGDVGQLPHVEAQLSLGIGLGQFH